MTKTETETESETVPAGQTEVTFGVDLSRGFTEWSATKRLSLATHQVGKPLSNEGVPTNVTLCFSPN